MIIAKQKDIKAFCERFTENLILDKIYPNARHSKIFSYLDEIFKFKNFNSAFEIGCGIGIISEYIRKYVPAVSSIDLSEENIKFAKSTVKNVHFRCTDLLELEINEKFDLITLFDVLEHFPKPSQYKVFEAIKTASTKNTLVAITIPDPDYLSFMREHHPEKLQVVDESIYFDEFKSLMDQYGLEIIKYKKYGIDFNDQYRFYLLGYKKEIYELEKLPDLLPVNIKNLISKIFTKSTTIFRKIKYGKYIKS